jgi:hypothetical protein
MKTAYKIFDLYGIRPKTLYHGIDGSRLLPIGKWVKAERKMVTDGSRRHPYLSGFHSYASLEEVTRWLQAAQYYEDRVVVKVKIKGCRPKPNAVRPTVLSNWLLILPSDWRDRIPATQLVRSV